MNLAALLDDWARRYDVRTVIERVLGDAEQPACAGLVAQGRGIVALMDDASATARGLAAYGKGADVRVASPMDAELPKSDLVVIHGGAPHDDWREELRGLGRLASKLVVLAVENRGAWRAELHARMADLKGETNGDAGWGRTEALAPVLWEIGRVREHTYLDVPPVGVRLPTLVRRLAPTHAFVIDVTPRSPQARRRLRLETV